MASQALQAPQAPEARPLAPSPSIDPTAPLPALSQLARAFFVWFFGPTSVAMAIKLALIPDRAALVSNNELAGRSLFLATSFGAGLVSCLLAAIYLLRRPTRASVDVIARISHVGMPLLLAFPLPLFFDWRTFRENEFLAVVSLSLYGLALERALRISFAAMPTSATNDYVGAFHREYPRLSRRLPALLVTALTVFFVGYFGYYTVLHHYRLQTHSWDLAIFDNMMWNLLRGEWFKATPDLGRTGSHIQYHATFSAYLFAPFYALRQSADTLLVLQALVTGLGAVPLYLLAKRRLASAWAGVLFAYAYVIYAPLHGPIFYDFHFLTTAPFWIGWVLYAFETGRRGWLIVAYLAAILLREDQSACLAMVFLFYLLTGQRPKWALSLGLASAVYFVAVKFAVMPAHRTAGSDKETFTWMFKALIPEGERGFGAVIKTVLSNPIYTLETLLEKDKLVYILKLLGPALFLPWRNGKTWILLVPAAIFTLLSTGYKPTIQTYFQYTSNWTAYLFFAAAVTMGSWRVLRDGNVRIAAALSAMLVTGTAMSYHHGAIFQHNTFRGGFRKVEFTMSDSDRARLADLYALIARIPTEASVAATETEAPHVCNRADCFTMRFGYDDADYLLVSVDEARRGKSHDQMKKALSTGEYGFVASEGDFALFAKGHPRDNIREGSRLLGISLR